MIKKIVSIVMVLISLTLCDGQAKPLKVVASFSILADIVKQIGGDRIDLISIVGPNGDTHVYEPTPEDGVSISNADIIFINGLKFETWFDRLVEAAGYKGPVIVASQGIKPHNMIDPYLSDKVVPDPHVWGDVAHVKVWARNIEKAFIDFDPDFKGVYVKNTKALLEDLDDLDLRIKDTFLGIPPKDCKIITAHDAFNYYEKAYGVVFLSPQGISTTDEPSAAEMVDLIAQIKKEGITTLFVENISNQYLIKQLAAETGARIGGVLYSDALSPKGEPGDTYINMMVHNTKAIRGALKCTLKAPLALLTQP